ncbi:MAG: hypothetical protein ACTSSG_03060 [Candidatus Heimdallarchaeaceae archaeon]
MNKKEEQIVNLLSEKGFSQDFVNQLRMNIDFLSSEFIVDILIDQINLYIDYPLLLEFLPKIWKNNENSSSNLLLYIGGFSHRILYLAREYPSGKKVPQYILDEIDLFHTQLCNFMSSCINDDFKKEEEISLSPSSFDELFNMLRTFPKFSHKMNEVLRITAYIYYLFALNKNQKIKNLDELALFLSRCLIFWKLNALNIEEIITCFNKAVEKFTGKLVSEKFSKILSLEIQNYQFLQLGINQTMIKMIATVFHKILVQEKIKDED